MCRLLISHRDVCGHGFYQAVACPLLMHHYNDATAANVSAQILNPETLDPDFGCNVVRGHIELSRPCSACDPYTGVGPIFFVRRRPLLPPCDPPTFSTDWAPATLCEWYSSFFVDKPHARGPDNCCASMRLCSAVKLAHEPGLACRECLASSWRFKGVECLLTNFKNPLLWDLAPELTIEGTAWVCDGCRVDKHHEFVKARTEVRIIRHLGSPGQRRPSLARRLSSRLKAKMSGKSREPSPPPPSRQNTLQWAVQARIRATEARKEKERK